jgi:hypothetical protein
MPAGGVDLSTNRYGMPGRTDGLSATVDHVRIACCDDVPCGSNAVSADPDGVSGYLYGLPAASRGNCLHSRRRTGDRGEDATRLRQARRNTAAQRADPIAASRSVVIEPSVS